MTLFNRLCALMAGGFVLLAIANWGLILFLGCMLVFTGVAAVSGAGKRKELR